MQHKITYSYLRTEADNNYTLFLPMNPALIDQSIDIALTDEGQLLLTIENGDTLITPVLNDDIRYQLANRFTTVIFATPEGALLGKNGLEPLRPDHAPTNGR